MQLSGRRLVLCGAVVWAACTSGSNGDRDGGAGAAHDVGAPDNGGSGDTGVEEATTSPDAAADLAMQPDAPADQSVDRRGFDSEENDGDTFDAESGSPRDGSSERRPTPDAPFETAIRDRTVPPGEGGGNWEAGVCPPEPNPQCAPATHLASAEELAYVINGFPWQLVESGYGRLLTISDDFVADVDLLLDASLLNPPLKCPSLDGGCGTIRFRDSLFPRHDDKHVAGLTCVGPGSPQPNRLPTCSAMSIAKGTTFRIRKLGETSVWGFFTYVELDRACPVVCDSDETRCEPSQTCLLRGYDTCSWCDGLPSAICGCRDRCGGPMADGTTCSYEESDDSIGIGSCASARCCIGSECPDR